MKLLIRERNAVRDDFVTRRQRGQMHFGNWKIKADRGNIIERGDHRTRCHQRTKAHLPQAEHAAERGGHYAIRQLRTQGIDPRRIGIATRLGRIEHRFRDRALVDQILQALVLGRRVDRHGLRFGQGGNLLAGGEFYQHVTRADLFAVGEIDLAHGLGDLRGQHHRLMRLCRANRFQRVAPRRGLHGQRGNRDWRLLGRRGIGRALAADQRKDQQGNAKQGSG